MKNKTSQSHENSKLLFLPQSGPLPYCLNFFACPLASHLLKIHIQGILELYEIVRSLNK